MIECLKRKEYEEVGEETVKMIEVLTGMKTKLKVKEGKVNMCRAMEELRREWKQEGEMIGLEIGLQKGEKKGKQEAEIRVAKEMIKDGFSDTMISKYVDLSLAMIKKIRKQIVNA